MFTDNAFSYHNISISLFVLCTDFSLSSLWRPLIHLTFLPTPFFSIDKAFLPLKKILHPRIYPGYSQMLTWVPKMRISLFFTFLPFSSAYSEAFVVKICLFKIANLMFQFNYKEGKQLQYNFVSMILRNCTSGFSLLSPPMVKSCSNKSPF